MTHLRNALKRLLQIFDNHYQCRYCDDRCAEYLINCRNPLHRLHDLLYKLEDTK